MHGKLCFALPHSSAFPDPLRHALGLNQNGQGDLGVEGGRERGEKREVRRRGMRREKESGGSRRRR